MEEWAQVKRHVADEITLLCDQHHREKTGKLLPKEVVREANLNPYNLRKGVSKPYDFHFSGTTAEIEIGGNSFTCEDHGNGIAIAPIFIDGQPLVSLVLQDGHLLLNIVVFDEFNIPILHINNNQLLYSVEPWDIQLVGTKLTIREGHRKILIEIEFLPPDKVKINRGRFLRNGVEVLVRPTHIFVPNNGNFIKGCTALDCPGGLVIGEPSIGGFLGILKVPRYLEDRSVVLGREREVLKEMKAYEA